MARPRSTSKKAILCVWRDWNVIVRMSYCRLIENNRLDLYPRQLIVLQQPLKKKLTGNSKQKRRRLLPWHTNPHTSFGFPTEI